jgi:aspyridone synthetase (hybrid polyketide synthase/nonribosomal peptide synthetase)
MIGPAATHDDALNSLIRYSLLTRTVPDLPNAKGFFDFRPVDDVAKEIVGSPLAETSIVFHHHSSGVKVPFDELGTRMEQLYGGMLSVVGIEEWIQKAAQVGLDDLIVSYLQANVVGRKSLDSPYLEVYSSLKSRTATKALSLGITAQQVPSYAERPCMFSTRRR